MKNNNLIETFTDKERLCLYWVIGNIFTRGKLVPYKEFSKPYLELTDEKKIIFDGFVDEALEMRGMRND